MQEKLLGNCEEFDYKVDGAKLLADEGKSDTETDCFLALRELIRIWTWIISRPMSVDCSIPEMKLSTGQTNTTDSVGFIHVLRQRPGLRHTTETSLLGNVWNSRNATEPLTTGEAKNNQTTKVGHKTRS